MNQGFHNQSPNQNQFEMQGFQKTRSFLSNMSSNTKRIIYGVVGGLVVLLLVIFLMGSDLEGVWKGAEDCKPYQTIEFSSDGNLVVFDGKKVYSGKYVVNGEEVQFTDISRNSLNRSFKYSISDDKLTLRFMDIEFCKYTK